MKDEIKKVPKVLGEEHWIVNENYCGKKLILNKGYKCSYHYHKLKDETFYVIKGHILFTLDGLLIERREGDSLRVKPNQKHDFMGIKDSEIIEFSTHHEDEDSYRLDKSRKV